MEIIIKDCNNKITLTQELGTVGEIENAIFKATTLSNHCLEVVAFLEGVLQEKKQATTKKTTTVALKTAQKMRTDLVEKGAVLTIRLYKKCTAVFVCIFKEMFVFGCAVRVLFPFL